MEKDYEIFKSIHGNEFSMKTRLKEYLSVLDGGYIITPEGKIVLVDDGEDHSDIFSQFIANYLDRKYECFQSIEACIFLNQYEMCAYYGIKEEDAKKSQGGGYGVFSFPKNLDDITCEQAEIIKRIISTNVSIFGNREILSLQFGTFENGAKYTKEEIVEILSHKKIDL